MMTEVSLFSQIQEYFVIQIIAFCFVIGYLIRNYTHIRNSYIPGIMIVVGVAANSIIALGNGYEITFDIVIIGAINGLASSGSYDLIRHAFKLTDVHKRRKSYDEDDDDDDDDCDDEKIHDCHKSHNKSHGSSQKNTDFE